MRSKALKPVIAAAVFGWLAFESIVLSGTTVANKPNHPIGEPLSFEVAKAGELYGITIDRAHRKRGKKHLEWKITAPEGGTVLKGHDSIARSTRMVYFKPVSTGTHALHVHRARESSGFAGTTTLIVNKEDRTILLRWLSFLW